MGGLEASGRVTTLLDNGISALVPCSSSVKVVKDSRVKDYGCVDVYGLLYNFEAFFLQALTERVLKDLHGGAKILLTCRHGTTRSAILAALVLMAGSDCSADDAHSYLRYLRNLVDLKSVPASWQKKADDDGVDPLELLRKNCATIQSFWKGEKFPLNCVISPGSFEYKAVEAGCVPIMPDEAPFFFEHSSINMSNSSISSISFITSFSICTPWLWMRPLLLLWHLQGQKAVQVAKLPPRSLGWK